MSDDFGPIVLKRDPKSLERHTMSVEEELEPLVYQITTLVKTQSTSEKKKGKSKRARALRTVKKITADFIEKGEKIAYENPDITVEMLSAVEEVRETDAAMSIAAREFSEDPCSSLKRGNMARAAENLRSTVTRLLILAEMGDVHLLLTSVYIVEDNLKKLKNASSLGELNKNIDEFSRNQEVLIHQADKHQHALKDPQLRDKLAAARAVLEEHSTMLLTTTKIYVENPDLAAAKANRDYVLKQMCEAVNTINDVAQRKTPSDCQDPYDGPGKLAAALDDFDKRIGMVARTYNKVRTRPSLEERLESIISGAALIADSSYTRDERRERIVAECNTARQALQDLLNKYTNNVDVEEQSEGLERAIEHMRNKTRDLRRQLRRGVSDLVNGSFLYTRAPQMVLEHDFLEMEKNVIIFTEETNKQVEVANLVCSMSNNKHGVKLIRYAVAQIEKLHPQVINALRVMAVQRTDIASENMEMFHRAWEYRMDILMDALDDIITIDDILASSATYILDDINKFVLTLQARPVDADTMDKHIVAMYSRFYRVFNIVFSEMNKYLPCIYTKRVLEVVESMRYQIFAFENHMILLNRALLRNPQNINGNYSIDAVRLIYDRVCDIRRAMRMKYEGLEL